MTATTQKRPAAAKDPLDALLEGDAQGVIALMLWKERMRCPDMFVRIDERDLKGFQDCCRYLKVIPEVRIFRPQGLPAQEARAAGAHRRAVPARPASPARPYVMVTLVEAGTENAIRPVENNQEDYDAAQAAAAVRKAKDQAQMLAERLVQQAQSGEYSLSDMQDAANALVTLARAI